MPEFLSDEYMDAIDRAIARIIEGFEMVLDPDFDPGSALPYHGEDDPYTVAARQGFIYGTRVA